MPLSVGERLGPYEILAPIGAGGMGEVYRARDTKLKRDVAMKVLPEEFARDPERMARFQREAEVLASLNHPNIAAIYGVEERALVMEMVEGATLAGPLPQETALDYFKQIAGALEYAHERGVVHRDLKPANIKITPEGVVKLLDFGLAKAVSVDPVSESRASEAPTLSIGATVAGVILGTAAYMAPEQARALKVDKRADIWAFGVVLYEMLAGKQLFAGETVTDVLAAVITKDPDWKPIPANFQRLLRRCLERDPKRRLRDIGDAMPLLEDLPAAAEVPRPGEAPRKVWPWAVGVGILAAALLVLAAIHFRETQPQLQAVLSTIALPEKMTPKAPALSPDGRKLVFVAAGADYKDQLWVRSLDAFAAQPIAGTTGASFPFWSADSRSLGFFADGKLKKIDVAGGPALALADATSGRGGAWNLDGVIVFAPSQASALERVSASGGSANPATKFVNGDDTHRWPWFLPDGRHFLYVGGKLGEPSLRIHLGDIASPEDKIIGDTDSNAVYSQAGSTGHLLFMRDTTLMARPFDPKRLTATGDAVPAVEQIRVSVGLALGVFSVSGNGLLVYQTGGPTTANLIWFDRAGKRVRTLGEPSDYISFRISPDGRRVATAVRSAAKTDVWLMDSERGVVTRLTSNGVSEDPLWSPDGRSIVFSSGIPVNLFLKESSGAGDERRLAQSSLAQYGNDWSRDGRVVIYDEPAPGTPAKRPTGSRQNDLWFLPMNPEGAAKPYLTTPFDEWEGRFSPEPNPRWVSYRSNETGRYEVYVQSFPEPRNKTRISTGGGSFAAWGPGGREIFYASPEGKLMAVSLKIQGDSVQPSAPQELFTLPSVQGNAYPYDVMPDGQRFLVRVPADETAQPLNLLVNWPALAK